jgi:hypothetical protein
VYESIPFYRRADTAGARARLDAGDRRVGGRAYPSATGGLHWMLGNVAMAQDRHGQAAEEFVRAREVSSRPPSLRARRTRGACWRTCTGSWAPTRSPGPNGAARSR